MNLQLEGKRAFVTGSNTGTAASIAKTLAREGAHVTVHGRDRDRAEAVAASIQDDGGKAAVVIGDLSSNTGTQQVADDARTAFGGVDMLINNAELIGYYETWDDVNDEDSVDRKFILERVNRWL
ncbi:SDR family NAD(P)-dependent oxidoreductase [Phormidium tenue FACHB-886]|nr:SDR family NAD(P)-dependent oxidoreductase [Phormidium tenue FACHB-886]